MLYRDALIVDYGPGFSGQATMVDQGIVCVVPDRCEASSEARGVMRELVERLGGDCGRCQNCPVGRSN